MSILLNYCSLSFLDALQSISIIIASVAAIMGLYMWRKEAKWKRQYELAEEILFLFYEAQDNIEAMRSFFLHPSEGKNRVKDEKEKKEVSDILDKGNIPYERYLKYQDSFNKLRTLKYRCMSIFGKDNGKPFEDINKIVFSILNHSQFLCWLEISREEGHINIKNENERTQYLKERDEHHSVIWAGYSENKNIGKDKIRIEVENIIQEVEGFCKPIIDKKTFPALARNFLSELVYRLWRV